MYRSKVLYIGYGMVAPTGGGKTRVISEALQARKHGVEPRVVCFTPAHVYFSIYRELSRRKDRMAKDADCPVLYVPRIPWTRSSFFSWLNDWFCAFVVLMLCWRHGIRIVHGHNFRPALFGILARRLNSRLRVVGDIHGAVADEYAYEAGEAADPEVLKRIEALEEYVIRRSDWLVLVAEAMREHYHRKLGVTLKNATVIPCAVDKGFDPDPQRRAQLREEHGLTDRTVFCYLGSGERYQLPEEMCELFRQFHAVDPSAFLLVLSGDQATFSRILEAKGLPPTSYRVTSVAHSEVLDLIQMADAGFLLRADSVVNRVASPTKFAEYCLAGLPVITTEFVGDFSGVVRDERLGWSVSLEETPSPQQLTGILGEIRSRRDELARRCNAFVREHLTWESYGDRLAAIHRRLEGSDKPGADTADLSRRERA